MKIKKLLKIIIISLVLVTLVVPLLGCGSNSGSAAQAEDQVITVQTGNITTAITAAGNLALSHTQDMPIELFYRQGTVGEVSVSVGDTVTEGQVLATIDAKEWDDELNVLENALVTAQRNLASKESALTSANRQLTAKEKAVTTAERQVTLKDFAVQQAELAVETAQNNLEQITEVKEAQDAIDDAQQALDIVKMVRMGEFGGGLISSSDPYWSDFEASARNKLTAAQEDLRKLLDGTAINVDTDVLLQVESKQMLVEQSKLALEDANTAVENAKSNVADAQLDVEDAKSAVTNAQLNVGDAMRAVQDAQAALDEAKSLSSVVKAPFDGFISKVNVKGGDEVLNGTIAVTVADPNKFEAEILVSEMDIMQVKLGTQAQVSVSALPGISLPAAVTQISPTATIQSGVVNYAVTVEVQSIEVLAKAGQASTSDNATPQFQGPTGGGFPSGNITRPGRAFGNPGAATLPSFQLRQGLSATVRIIVSQKTNVLVVPNTAITSQGRQVYVQVLLPDGKTEQRAIQTGITDYVHTEVISGLSQGEKVVIPAVSASTTSTSTSEPGPPGGGIFFGR